MCVLERNFQRVKMEFKDCGSISYCSIIIHPHHVSVVDNVFSRLCSAQLIYLEHLCSIVYQPLHHAIGAAQSRSSQGKNRTSSTTKILFELVVLALDASSYCPKQVTWMAKPCLSEVRKFLIPWKWKKWTIRHCRRARNLWARTAREASSQPSDMKTHRGAKSM